MVGGGSLIALAFNGSQDAHLTRPWTAKERADDARKVAIYERHKAAYEPALVALLYPILGDPAYQIAEEAAKCTYHSSDEIDRPSSVGIFYAAPNTSSETIRWINTGGVWRYEITSVMFQIDWVVRANRAADDTYAMARRCIFCHHLCFIPKGYTAEEWCECDD